MAVKSSPSYSLKATISKCLVDFIPKSLANIRKYVEKEEKHGVSEMAIQLILEGNPDLFIKNSEGLWSIVMDEIPEHQAAFEILRESTKMLTLFQLNKKVAAKLPKNQRNQIVLNLEKDARFVCYEGKKWALKEKVNVIEQAFEYLKTSDEAVTERKLLRILANQVGVEPEKLLFDPITAGDKRFFHDQNDRWILTEKRKVVAPPAVAGPQESEGTQPRQRRKVEAVTIELERIDEIERMFDNEKPIWSIGEILHEVFTMRPDHENYETMEFSLIRALKKQVKFEPISLDEHYWTLETLLPAAIRELPHPSISEHIRTINWTEFGDQDTLADGGLAEDEMIFEAQKEERPGVLQESMQMERILSAFEYEYGILFVRPCDRPFFPDKPTYLRFSFHDELNKRHEVFLNNRLNFLFGLKEWYKSIENPFAARFFISGNPTTSEYRLLYKRDADNYHQLTSERVQNLKEVWKQYKAGTMRVTELVLEVMKHHKHGTDPKRLLWEVCAVRHFQARTIYGILSYFQCFARKKGTDRWYLDEKLIGKGPDPDKIEFLEKRTRPRMGEWIMSPKDAERVEKLVLSFKDWEGREAYFAFHERTQKTAREKAKIITAKKLGNSDDLKAFFTIVSDLFESLNWRKNDPDSGCWNLVLIHTEKWGIFESVENANRFIELLSAFLEEDDPDELDGALEDFISYGIRGLQSATLSPVLFCLQPQLFAVINKSIATGFERLTNAPLSTELVDYMAVNELMREFLLRYDFFDFSDADGFFSHCISGHLELEAFDDLMKVLPIKRAMDILAGEYSKDEEQKEVEIVQEQASIDSATKKDIAEIANKLFATEDLMSDLARQLTEIRIQSIWQSGNVAKNFDNFLEANFARPQYSRFLTPRPVIDLMVRLIEPKVTEKAIDMCMGSAGFLIRIGQLLREQLSQATVEEMEKATKITLPTGEVANYANEVLGEASVRKEEGRERLLKYILNQNLLGLDIDQETFKAARLNLKLHHLEDVNVLVADSLSKKIAIDGLGSHIYDVAIGHPPIESGASKKFLKEFIRTLKPNGRLVILLGKHEFNEKQFNKELLKDRVLDAVITLPEWDESKYGPSCDLLLIRTNKIEAPMYKATLNSYDETTVTNIVEAYRKRKA